MIIRKLEPQRLAYRYGGPLLEQFPSALPNCPDALDREPVRARSAEFAELLQRPYRAAGALAIEQTHDVLHVRGLLGQRPARAFPGGVLDLPTLRYQSEKTTAASELGLHGEMRQVMQGEERRMPVRQFLPGGRPVVPHAAQHPGTIGALGDFDQHALIIAGSG